jgi:hypothetical protein
MNKDVLERCCLAAGLVPERRERIRDHDVFVADGFAARPDVTFKRFGVTKGEFPFGAYATIWWTAKGEDKIDVGCPLLFEAFHDPQLAWNMKQKARINTALLEAHGFLKRRERAHAEQG